MQDKVIFEGAHEEFVPIDELRFLRDNPRVYAVTHGHAEFQKWTRDQQQAYIYKQLKEEPSVKNLIQDIERLGQLVEPIVVRWDTKEVVEGNSRLAVYRQLNESDPEGDWATIHCRIISSLTPEEQATFLNLVHVKGKTQWSAYEQANFAYVRKASGWSFKKIASVFGESEGTIRGRIKVIELMKANGDSQRAHFSFYKVLVANPNTRKGLEKAGGWKKILTEIKGFTPDNSSFSAKSLRDKMPVILKKPKVLKKFLADEVTLEQAYDRAKISNVEENVRTATTHLSDISRQEVMSLKQNDRNRFNAFGQAVRKLVRETNRISNLLKSLDK